MTQEVSTCGVGGGNFPQPGDPNLNDVILSARSQLFGIAVSWTWPAVNPGAVAHTLVYRSKTNSYATAVLLGRSGSSRYLDENEVEIGTEFFYWIEMVSVNGTVGALIGPASATRQPTNQTIIDLLVGRLEDNVLTQSLRTRINRITDLSSAVDSETQNRIAGYDVFSELLSNLTSELDRVDSLIYNESITRIQEDSVFTASVSGLLVKFENNAAAIDRSVAINATANSALALQVDTLQVTVNDVDVSVQNFQEVINGPEGLSAQWYIKTDVGGYVSGFGTYNDGVNSLFLVNTSTFAVGTVGHTGVFPFIIAKVNGETQIALNARTLIPDASITNASIENAITSDNFKSGVRGWGIFKDFLGYGAYAEFNDIKARGDIEATSIKGDIIEAKHIKGGAVSSVLAESGTSGTIIYGGEKSCFSMRPVIPPGMVGNVICMLHFQGQGQNSATNVGVKVYRGTQLIHSNSITAPEGLTAGSATSFTDSNVTPGTRYTVRMTNTWSRGTVVQAKAGGSMMITFL
jgi:hypothetical protein